MDKKQSNDTSTECEKKIIAKKTYAKGINKARCALPLKALDDKNISTTRKSAAEGRNIIITITGSDAFLIDALRLKVAHKKYRKWGRNNGKAWCLSTDKNDAKKKWKKVVNACYKSIEFRSNGKAYGRR